MEERAKVINSVVCERRFSCSIIIWMKAQNKNWLGAAAVHRIYKITSNRTTLFHMSKMPKGCRITRILSGVIIQALHGGINRIFFNTFSIISEKSLGVPNKPSVFIGFEVTTLCPYCTKRYRGLQA
ncbi:MAG: hypothetical protein AAGU74_01835 [Bacillota bacterium]